MSDSIGSYNEGMPGGGTLVPDSDNTTIGVPHDLIPSERARSVPRCDALVPG